MIFDHPRHHNITRVITTHYATRHRNITRVIATLPTSHRDVGSDPHGMTREGLRKTNTAN